MFAPIGQVAEEAGKAYGLSTDSAGSVCLTARASSPGHRRCWPGVSFLNTWGGGLIPPNTGYSLLSCDAHDRRILTNKQTHAGQKAFHEYLLLPPSIRRNSQALSQHPPGEQATPHPLMMCLPGFRSMWPESPPRIKCTPDSNDTQGILCIL